MDKSLLSPTNDFVFKKIFAEHDTVLIDFLKSILDLNPEDYQSLVIVDPHIRRESIEDKEAILDVKIKLKNGKDIDVEMQVREQATIWKRIQYYTSDMYVNQIKKGGDYECLTTAISILITNFILIKNDDEYHHHFRFYDENAKIRLPDASLEIHTLEIPKDRSKDRTNLSNWLNFFAAKTQEEFMIASEKSPAIAQAYGILKNLSADEEARLLAESREKGRRDIQAGINDAYREGEQKGEQKGKQEGKLEGKLEVARNLLREGLSAETIAKFTGLSIAEIEQLAKV